MENTENIDEKSLYYLEKAPVTKAIIHMAIPMILSSITSVVYNIIDAFFIGKLNNTAMMAAVMLALPFSSVLMALGQMFGVGSGTYISRLLGEGNTDDTKKVSSINFWSSMLMGIIFMMICLPFLSSILPLLGASGETLQHTRNFIMILVIGAPVIIVNMALESAVRAEGASTVSMTGTIGGIIVNIILNPLFIFVLNMNVMGSALASVCGNIVSISYFIYYLQKKSTVQSLSIKYFKPSKKIYGEIFKVGVSALLLSGFMVIIGLLFNNYSMIYGDNVVAGFGVAQRVVQIVDCIGMGFAMGVVPLIAFAYSANNQKRLMEIVKKTILYILGLTLVIGAVISIFRLQIIGLFSIDPEVIAIGEITLIAQLSSTIFAALCEFFTGIFQAQGAGVQSNVMAAVRGVLFIPILIVGNLIFAVNGVIWAMTATEGLSCLIGIALWLGIRRKSLLAI
ncbi:MATE family efflux transporter [Clostridium beijerinckii]|uniref:Multidrug export protein MepA n=2 Tax=Clostridium beijerinckii TaxID=1520 RepID=A0AB74VHB0_CLOBE|nr:MATE family efflux transporter [Clostridium beijerinckii]AQS03154.1 multidrug export protein MepA [Clostridium beijerinckii]MBA2886609.1 putative MATE family efflux protein [Clostridium beijerinckii]MBA2901302.1 putative MATE family efflux protein [Clostridium beijerinckii]MBA2911169.1 putative MATE family efflux protein [Clostridium beijerinckii]MBA9017311.1 putative MATE family efflux protein [Clostridium beijerinckii]